jgi:hypothetical protein
MSQTGKSHLVIMFTVGPDDVAEGDRIFASHGEFMRGHPREGDVALLDYSVSKGPELSNPMDANSEPTGNTTFVVPAVQGNACMGRCSGSETTPAPTAGPRCSPTSRWSHGLGHGSRCRRDRWEL